MKKTLLSLGVITASLTCSAYSAVLWTTTFSGTDGTDRVLTNTPGTIVGTTATDILTFQDTSFSGNAFLHNGSTASGIYYSPNTNVDNPSAGGGQNTGSWTSVFNYGAGSTSFSLESISLGLVRFGSTGSFSDGTDGLVRDINFTVEYSLNGGGAWTPIETKTLDSTASNPVTNVIPLDFALATPVTVDLANDQFSVRFTAANTGGNTGAYIGMESVSINVPEPSTALLGALGMLALLRRRRA